LKNKYLITGTAGFIGFHLARELVRQGFDVVGLDSINDYYDVNLKHARLAETGINISDVSYGQICQSVKHENYRFIKCQLEDRDTVQKLFETEKFTHVCNLAAQAGVRYSLENPYAYVDSNVSGFINILEGCRHHGVENLVYASTSSVYGLNKRMPLSENHPTEHPMTLYAATKKANEMMAHSYSHLFGLPTTGLRFFTVYGPWGRPDMALFLFTKAILNNEPVNVFNYGNMVRDFTYIDDIVDGVIRCLQQPSTANSQWNELEIPDSPTSSAPYRIFNIGNATQVKVSEYIDIIEEYLGKKANRNMMPMQLGDVAATEADLTSIRAERGYSPKTSVREGVKNFLDWYLEFYSNPKI
jgi:UDP-glucuronate 4-epimerase